MPPRLLLCAFLLSLPLVFGACRDSKVASYRIPKEPDAAPAPAAPTPDGPAHGADNPSGVALAKADGAGLEWVAPASWKAKPVSAMRKGSYTVGGEGGTGADLAITAFPGDVGGDLANVNRWRGQLGLAPIADAELAAALTPVEANGLKMKVVDLAGGTPDQPLRMLGAIVPFEGATWFFKLTGPDALVAAAKPGFLEFIQTVKPSAAPAAPAAPEAVAPGLKWVAPPHWQSKPASAMRKATYVVAGDNGATAELSVTAFPGSVGGELANVARWRGQLQLSPLPEAELAKLITRQTVNGLSVTLVDLTGGTKAKPVRLLGAIVPTNGANWFFKFTGPPPLVAKEQASFLALIQSLQAP